jgi:hypothetical protein
MLFDTPSSDGHHFESPQLHHPVGATSAFPGVSKITAFPFVSTAIHAGVEERPFSGSALKVFHAIPGCRFPDLETPGGVALWRVYGSGRRTGEANAAIGRFRHYRTRDHIAAGLEARRRGRALLAARRANR